MEQKDLIITDDGTFIKLNVHLYKHPNNKIPAHLTKFFDAPMRISRKKIKLNSAGGYVDPEIKTYGVEIDPTAIIGNVNLRELKDEKTQLKISTFTTKIGPGVIICDDVEFHGRHGEIAGPVFIGHGHKTLWRGADESWGVFRGTKQSGFVPAGPGAARKTNPATLYYGK